MKATTHCLARRRLLLLPNGMLALQDRTNNTLWSSQSACLCDQGCYSYYVTNTGRASIIDQYGMETWNSAGTPGMLQPAAGRPLQLLSSGRALSCIEGTAQRLLAPDSSAELRMSSRGKLELVDATGPVVWTAPGAAGAPALKTCVQKDGVLRFTGSTGASVLWSSPAAGPAQPGPYVAMLAGPVVQVGVAVSSRLLPCQVLVLIAIDCPCSSGLCSVCCTGTAHHCR